MEAASSPVGVALTTPAPSAEWQPATPWMPPPSEPSVRLPAEAAPVWSRSTQTAAVLLLLLALTLLGWHLWNAQRGRCRPAALESGTHVLLLDLNQADRVQLLQLPGVGEPLAQRIEAYRNEHHGFRSVEELRHVKGIGAKVLDKLRPYVYVEAPPSDDNDEPAAEPVRSLSAKAEKEDKPFDGGKKKLAADERIDVNHASAAELRRLPHIGPTMAQHIIETRQRKPFRSLEDLRRVPRIGPETLKALRPHVVIILDNTEQDRRTH